MLRRGRCYHTAGVMTHTNSYCPFLLVLHNVRPRPRPRTTHLSTQATAEDVSIHACTARSPALTRSGVKQRPGSLARTAPEFHTPLSASDASLLASASTGSAHSHLNAKSKNSARRREYSKYWDDADTERGRFGSSVDDNAVGSSAPGAAADDAAMVEAAMAAGVRGLGKGGVHWGKHHHHHGAGSDEGMSEPLIGDATLKLRHLYFQRKHMRPNLVSEGPKSPAAGAHRGSRGGLGGRGKAVVKGGPVLTTRRSAPTLTEGRGRGRGRRQGTEVGVSAPARRSSFAGQGWESHTLQAQQKTDEYMQGREDLAPGMRPAVVLDNEVCFDRGGSKMSAGNWRATIHVFFVVHVINSPSTDQSIVNPPQSCGFKHYLLTQSVNDSARSRGVSRPAWFVRLRHLTFIARSACSPMLSTHLQVSLAYDVDLSEAGVLGAGAYGTVLAAVHRSTGRQVGIVCGSLFRPERGQWLYTTRGYFFQPWMMSTVFCPRGVYFVSTEMHTHSGRKPLFPDRITSLCDCHPLSGLVCGCDFPRL